MQHRVERGVVTHLGKVEAHIDNTGSNMADKEANGVATVTLTPTVDYSDDPRQPLGWPVHVAVKSVANDEERITSCVGLHTDAGSPSRKATGVKESRNNTRHNQLLESTAERSALIAFLKKYPELAGRKPNILTQ